jgi:HD-GYP domain-containing protein (c-di-GMP phosphodiesterase class II)
VRSSHERFDGKGYPDGLAGEAIPLAARIVFVCDAFDAMTSDRSYKSAMPSEVAIAELRACAGTQFDPVVVDAFAHALERSARAAA